jgi:glycine/D-amino acid oxidase-like deaminating enzyme
VEQRSFPLPAARSLWADTAASADIGQPLEGERRADVVIIGAGYTGLSTAHHLAAGGAQVIVLEASEVGWGGSGRNGGVVSGKFRVSVPAVARTHGRATARRMGEIGHEAVECVAELVERYGIKTAAFRRSGNLRCAHTPAALEALRSEAAILRDQFGDQSVSVLGRDEVAEETGSRLFLGGLLNRDAGTVHPLNYVRGLAGGLRAEGVQISERSPAVALRRDGTEVVVETPGGSVRAPQAVIATNAYSDLAGATARLHRMLIPFRSAIIATEPIGDALSAKLMPRARSYGETRRMMRWFRKVDGRVLFGGRGAFGKSDSPGAFDALRRAMVGIFPELADARITHRWSGLVGMTLDSVPQVGRLDDRVSYALGYNGAGVAMASLMGRYLARIVRGESADLALLYREKPGTVPFYPMREPAVRLVAGWYQFLDAIGR